MTIISSDYQDLTCWKCGCVWWVPANMYRSATGPQRGDQDIYCPNGHSNIWTKGESAEDKLRRERDRLVQDRVRLEDERRTADKARHAAVAALARHKKRAAAGTCPCCKRTFSALATHMKTQHPEFIAEQGAKVVPIKRPA